jgi:hypothetical protein
MLNGDFEKASIEDNISVDRVIVLAIATYRRDKKNIAKPSAGLAKRSIGKALPMARATSRAPDRIA